jgi:HEAT repeat protein
MKRSRIWNSLCCGFAAALLPACAPLPTSVSKLNTAIAELGRESPPVEEPPLIDPWAVAGDLSDPEPIIRAAAVRRLGGEASVWNEQAIALLDDEHPQVRIAALESLPANVSAASDNLVARLRDPELGVKLAAIAAAGRSQLPAAQAELRELATTRGEAIRAAAVAALIVSGDADTVRTAAEDKAWQVRLEAARGLRLLPNTQGQQLARRLLEDNAPAIRLAVVQAVEGWPLKLAAPLWFETLEPDPRAARADRAEAARLLAKGWPPAAELPIAALLNKNATGHAAAEAELAKLHERWRREHPQTERVALATASTPSMSSSDVLEVDDCLTLLSTGTPGVEQDRAIARLNALEDRLLPSLREVARQRGELPERVYREVLALRDPVHQMLFELEETQPAPRRAAAVRLHAAARQEPLDELALLRLESLTLRASDPFVWQSALGIVSEDRREPALRLTLAAASHPEGDLRAQACELLGRTRDPRFAPMLRAAIDDADDRVVVAAELALGLCGAADDASKLEQHLHANLPEVRLAAAEGLAALAPEKGLAALERLALDRRAPVRQRAVEAMGRVGDEQLTAALIPRLDDEASVRHAALASLRKIAPQAGKEIEPAGQGTTTEADEIAAWKSWSQQAAAATTVQ